MDGLGKIMRILYITRSDSVHDQRFMATMLEAGHQVYLLRLLQGNWPVPEGIHTVSWTGVSLPLGALPSKAISELRKLIRRINPDLVHAGPLQDAAWLAAKAGAFPLMAMSWGFDLMLDVDRSPQAMRRAKYALSKAQSLIVDALCSADKAVILGFDPQRIVRFPWGVDLEVFKPDAAQEQAKALRRKLGWEDALVCLCLRSWEPNYGVDVLAKAFVQAAKAEPRLRLLLLNTGSQAEQILSILERGDVLDKVHLPVRINNLDLPLYYAASDLYLSPSHVDGSSVSLMEAMAMGLPSIVSDIPANKEWIQEGKQGWLFHDGDVDELEGLLRKAITADLLPLQRAARSLAEQKADWNSNKQKLIDSYRQFEAPGSEL